MEGVEPPPLRTPLVSATVAYYSVIRNATNVSLS